MSIKLIFGLDWGVSIVTGAILVVSGPTVVLPLLAYVRPSETVRSVLKWEGTLIDPIGALLGVIAFSAVKAGAGGGRPFHPGELSASLAVGLLVGAAATAVLWLLLRGLQRTTPRQAIPAALMCVAAALVAGDLIREDAGFVATTTMGIALANQRSLDVSRILEFHGTVVNLLIGILFVLLSASVIAVAAARHPRREPGADRDHGPRPAAPRRGAGDPAVSAHPGRAGLCRLDGASRHRRRRHRLRLRVGAGRLRGGRRGARSCRSPSW